MGPSPRRSSGRDRDTLVGPDAQEAKSATIAAVGGRTITDLERDDGDDGYGTSGGVYEVEIKREDGTQVEVHLDGDYNGPTTTEIPPERVLNYYLS